MGRALEILGQGELATDKRLVDIRPIYRFVERIEARGEAQHIAVVGVGAAGVDIAFALRNRGRNCARNRHGAGAEAEAEAGAGSHVDGTLEPQDLIIASLGSAAPQWIRQSGLAADAQGFVAVNQHQRSVSHPDVFAVGDVAARQDRDVAHSGVHAVIRTPSTPRAQQVCTSCRQAMARRS